MAQLDYLRLASFNFNYASLMAEFMGTWSKDWKPAKWLQYSGWRSGQLFIGAGEQKRKRHMVISCSGADSNNLAAFMFNDLDFYCTRIDVQRTIEKPEHAQLRRIRKATKSANTTIIQSPENDTLYIGSRTSDLFTRLYEKPLDTMFLRLEFELKGKRARSAWGAMIHGKTPSHVFSHYLDKSKLPNVVKAWFSEPEDDLTYEAIHEEIKDSAKKKLAWIRSLDESMEHAMADHDIGEQVRAIVRMWAKFADKLDEIGEPI